MFGLLKLVFFPISFALKLLRLPFTIISCITKLGCLLMIGAVVAVIIVAFIYLN